MIKKLLTTFCFVLSLCCLSLGLVACGGNNNKTNNNTTPPPPSDFTFSIGYIKDEVPYEGVCVTKYTGTSENVVIPDTYNGQPVVAIGAIFYDYWQSETSPGNNIKIKSVTIPNTVTDILDSAFNYCTTLESVTMSDNVTYIGSGAFSFCKSLKAIDLPSTLRVIKNNAFINCASLEELTIPDGVTEIGGSAFSSCYKIQAVEIPESVTSVGNGAFSNCFNLMQAILPSNATLGENLFYQCNRLVEVINKSSLDPNTPEARTIYGQHVYSVSPSTQFFTEVPQQSNFIKEDDFIFYDKQGELLLINYTGSDTSVTVPTTAIGDRTFKIRDYLFFSFGNEVSCQVKHFNTSDRATAIEIKAFGDNPTLLSLVVGENVARLASTHTVTLLWESALEIVNLSSIDFNFSSTNNHKYCAQYLTAIPQESNFFEQDGFTYYRKGSTVALVDGDFGARGGEAKLPEPKFEYVLDMKLPWLKKLTVPSCVRLEKPGSFYGYFSSVEEVIIEEGITRIPEKCFWYASSLKRVSIPNSVTVIEKNAFSSELELFEKDGCKYVGNAANNQLALVAINNSSASEITISGNVKVVANGLFDNCANLTTVYWFIDGDPTEQHFGDKFNSLTFKYHNITPTTSQYTIPSALTTLKYKHLEGASSLKELVIPANITKIQAGALKDLTALEKITLPSTGGANYGQVFGTLFGQKTGGIAQSNMGGAETEYAIPTTLTEINVIDGVVADWYFNGCKNVEKANFDSITEIGVASFEDTGFVTITLTDALTKLGNSAFANCSKLETVVLPENAKAFELGTATVLGAMFVGCLNLTSLTLPDVQVISSQSFENLSGLTVYYYNDFIILDANANTPSYLDRDTCFSNVTFTKK